MFESMVRDAAAAASAATPAPARAPAECAAPSPLQLATLSAAVPGTRLSGVLDAVELAELDEFALIEVLGAAHRQVANAQARLVEVLGEVARRRPDPIGIGAAHTRQVEPLFSEFAADEVAAALSLSPTGAASLLGLAVRLHRRLPATLAALRAGRIDWARAWVIAEETDVLVGA